MIWLAVAVRILANPFSNVFQKILTRQSANPFVILCVTHALLSLACAPVFLFIAMPVTRGFWISISICALLAVAANGLIIQALSLSDLSVLGPINAWKPVVSLLPSLLLLREVPGRGAMYGIALVVVGSYLIVDGGLQRPLRNFRVRFLMDRGIQCRFAALVLSAIEAVFLKNALRDSSPAATFVWWSFLGFVASGAVIAAWSVINRRAAPVIAGCRATLTPQMRREAAMLPGNRRTCLLLAATTGLMQFCTIVTLDRLQVGNALALFQTSALISVILGRKVFDEPHFLRRITGAAVMVAGAALIILDDPSRGTS
jgi:drug/metabolite transporter (DMT)-like permease